MRLDKYIAFGLGKTRSEARGIIRDGLITINNEVVRKHNWIVDEDQDEIKYDNELLTYKRFIYVMLYKPAGYLSATKDENYPTVVDLIKEYANYDLFMVGRLDIDTEGLMIMTNDGKFAHRITSPKRNVPKKYFVRVNQGFTSQDVKAFLEGFSLYDGHKNLYQTKPAQLEILNNNEAYITISEGKYHQIKKMCLKVGQEVQYLKRLSIGPIALDPKLKPGEYRLLTETEQRLLENYCLKGC